MRKIFFLLLCLNFAHAADKPPVADLLKAFLPGAKLEGTAFKVQGCNPYSAQWTSFFLLKQAFTAEYKFGPNCDIQGKVNFVNSTPFPMNLQLRNFQGYSQVVVSTVLSLDPQTMVLKITMDKGELVGRKTEFFSGNYQVKVSLQAGKLAYSNDSGEVHFYENATYQKKVASLPVKLQ